MVNYVFNVKVIYNYPPPPMSVRNSKALHNEITTKTNKSS